MRELVLVDANYGVHLYRHGVLRSSASYDPNDVHNRFAHLTNHRIATEHEEYGKFEPTNEVSLRVGTRAMSDARASATEIHLHSCYHCHFSGPSSSAQMICNQLTCAPSPLSLLTAPPPPTHLSTTSTALLPSI